MSFKTEEKIIKRKRWYSDRELQEFDTKLNGFKDSNGCINWKKVFVAEDVEREDGSVICNGMEYGKDGEIISASIPKNELTNKISQWEVWDLKQQGGYKRKMLQFDQIAIQQGFKAPPPNPEANLKHAENDLERIARIRKENDF